MQGVFFSCATVRWLYTLSVKHSTQMLHFSFKTFKRSSRVSLRRGEMCVSANVWLSFVCVPACMQVSRESWIFTSAQVSECFSSSLRYVKFKMNSSKHFSHLLCQASFALAGVFCQ